MKTEYRFYMKLSREEYLKYYTGEASCIQVLSDEGISLQYPATAVKPWVTHQGVEGYFSIKLDANHKLVEIKKLD